MRKKFFSLLVLLAVVVTGAVAQTETLLTTITATAKEQASYSTANVATVSFSYTAHGSSAYLANWGWWGYGWSATVNAAEGYTITKCVFYDDQNRTATDSEAPFVVETTEEDKTPKVNGTPILEYTSKGIKKIDVYGYENPTTVNVTGITLSQTEAAMTVGGETLTLTATVNPNNATDQSVSWSTSDANVATVENGVVTAVAAGTATITVTTTDGSFTATCAITVTAPEPQPATIQATQFNVPANWEVNADPITASDLPGFTAATTEQAMALANDLLAANPNLFATLIYGLGNNVLYIIINGPYSAPEADSNPYYTKGSAWEDQYEYYNTVFYTSGGEEPEPTGVENVQSDKVQGTKFFRDGMLLIEKNGKIYNVMGAEVK